MQDEGAGAGAGRGGPVLTSPNMAELSLHHQQLLQQLSFLHSSADTVSVWSNACCDLLAVRQTTGSKHLILLTNNNKDGKQINNRGTAGQTSKVEQSRDGAEYGTVAIPVVQSTVGQQGTAIS